MLALLAVLCPHVLSKIVNGGGKIQGSEEVEPSHSWCPVLPTPGRLLGKDLVGEIFLDPQYVLGGGDWRVNLFSSF